MVVTRGGTYLSLSVRPGIGRKRDNEHGSLERLTLRHREVLTLISHGLRTREIANELGIHVKTVESHRAEVMNRLGIRTIAGLVRYAIWTGLVPLEPAMASSMVSAEAGEAQTLLR